MLRIAVFTMSVKTTRHEISRLRTNKAIAYVMLPLGVISLIASILYVASVLAFIGMSLVFWGALFLYITPSKHVPVEMLKATVVPALINIEKIVKEYDLNGKGVYLPPKYLKNFESSLVFIPSKADQALPKPEEVNEEKVYTKNPKGIFLTPPGLSLLKLFEKELGESFIKIDLNYVQNSLPKLLTSDLEIAKRIDITTENNSIKVEIANHVFDEICQETQKLPKLRASVGCPLCSAIACALAKTTGRPIRMEKEEQSPDGKTSRILFSMLEG